MQLSDYDSCTQSTSTIILRARNEPLTGQSGQIFHINPWSSELYNLNCRRLEVVSRYRDSQLHVTEKYLIFSKIKYQRISVFQYLRHILILRAGYTTLERLEHTQ